MKVLVGAFNQEKALVGALSVIIVKTDCETDGSFYSTSQDCRISAGAGGVEAEVCEVFLALGHHLAVHRVALDQSEVSTVAE